MSDAAAREAVRAFWNAHPCATRDVPGAAEAGADFFRALDERRYSLEPFIGRFAAFGEQAGRRLLEVGCGTGGDLHRFVSAGARAAAIDLSLASLLLTQRRFELAGSVAPVSLADAERLPFADGSFDVVYSWGVLHHAPDPERTFSEIRRVLADRGEARIMLYHRRSLFALQVWLRYGLLRGRVRSSFADTLAAHVESPGTKAYTVPEVREAFGRAGFVDVRVTPVLTVWDARVGRRLFLPRWLRALLPDRWGFFLLITARPAAR